MRRTDTYTAHAQQSWQKDCVCECLAASCAFYNELNYKRRQAYFTTGNWKTATYTALYDEYAPVISKATCQQLVQKNSEAWTSFDRVEDKYHDHDDSSVTDEPSPPGYWGNRNDGYELQTVIRQDLYEITWNADTSTIQIPVGKALNEKYNIPGRGYRVELELRGNPKWKGKNSRLELQFDEQSDCFRVNHPVRVQPDYQQLRRDADFTHTPTRNTDAPDSDSRTAAIDVGANNTLSIVTDTGDVLVFNARPEFEAFQRQSQTISEFQSALPDGVYSSQRIRSHYDQMYEQRDHHRNAAVKQAADWLLNHNVDVVYVGDLKDVLSTHWSATVNQKTHNFWSHGQLTDQLADTFAVAGIELAEVSEAETSSTCPRCGSENVTRCGDDFACTECHVESHADVVGAAMMVAKNTGISVCEWFAGRPMARPAAPSAGRGGDGEYHVTYLQWDAHKWTPQVTGTVETLGAFDQRGFSEPAISSGRQSGCVAHRGIPRL